jgi:hypothetical protein
MRSIFSLFFLLLTISSFSQRLPAAFSYIDTKVLSIETCSPDSLSQKLTASYVTDREKIRSIFRWITENIAYKTRNYIGYRNTKQYQLEEKEDSLSESASLNERIARDVLKQKEAVCDGYSRLLKVLCNYAGIRAEIVTGYARADINRMGAQFKSNHRWNAVLLDSSWYLLDATWASGYIAYSNNRFVKAYNEYYFLTPPEDFIRDHYPEDARWSLLSNPPTLKEFYRTPFRHSAFSKYSIQSFAPQKGVIEASVGDTVKVELNMATVDRLIASDTLKDEVAWLPYANKLEPLQPVIADDKKVTYQYPITSENIEWLNIIYNNDVILRYKLNVKKSKEE